MQAEDAAAKIDQLRAKIDALDDEIVADINKRAELVLEIRTLKEAAGFAVHDPDREAKILQRLDSINDGPVGTYVLKEIFQIILEQLKQQ